MQGTLIKSTARKLLMNNNRYIPLIGIGTSGVKKQEDMDIVIKSAYDAGYKMVDSAIAYKNEDLIGNSIINMNIPRNELFLVTKIPCENVNKDNARDILIQSMKNFKTDYLDLVLLHWPGYKDVEERLAVWRVLESLVKEGKIFSIGVSNFLNLHLKSILDNCEIKPAVNQIELHPLFIDKETIDFCRQNNIIIEAYSGFAKFDEKLLKSSTLLGLAEKFNKKPTQVLMRWLVQNDFVTIPKSTKRDRIFENVEIDDFYLSSEDIQSLFDLNCNYKVISKWNPITVTY
jgi:diketogulonate reductase-like aldo/keto reductase